MLFDENEAVFERIRQDISDNDIDHFTKTIAHLGNTHSLSEVIFDTFILISNGSKFFFQRRAIISLYMSTNKRQCSFNIFCTI